MVYKAPSPPDYKVSSPLGAIYKAPSPVGADCKALSPLGAIYKAPTPPAVYRAPSPAAVVEVAKSGGVSRRRVVESRDDQVIVSVRSSPPGAK